MWSKITYVLLMCLVTCSPALAAHPLVTDDTGTQGRGKGQLELNGEVGWDKGSASGIDVRERAAELAAALSYGATDTVDLIIGLPWTWNRIKEAGVVDDQDGIGDISVELKWRFFEHRGLSLAIKPGVSLPTGDEERGLGTGKPSFGASLIASQTQGPATLHIDTGYAKDEYRLEADRQTTRSNIWHASAAGTIEIVKSLLLVANVGVETNSDLGSRTWPAFALGGAIWSPSENLHIDLGVKVGLNRPAQDLAILAGVAVHF